MTYRCDVCGTDLPLGSCKAKVGVKEFCGPDGSSCHRLGLTSARWTAEFGPTDAAALLLASAQQ